MIERKAFRPVCVSMCGVRETEDIHGERHTQRHKTDTKTHTHTHTEIKRNRNTESDTHPYTERYTHTYNDTREKETMTVKNGKIKNSNTYTE